jgi:Flp pilus assembly pilin Flp
MTRADDGPPSPSHESQSVKDNDMVQRIVDRAWQRFWRSDRGQDLIEYALLVALIVIVVIAAVSPVGMTLKTVFWDVIAASSAI